MRVTGNAAAWARPTNTFPYAPDGSLGHASGFSVVGAGPAS